MALQVGNLLRTSGLRHQLCKCEAGSTKGSAESQGLMHTSAQGKAFLAFGAIQFFASMTGTVKFSSVVPGAQALICRHAVQMTLPTGIVTQQETHRVVLLPVGHQTRDNSLGRHPFYS